MKKVICATPTSPTTHAEKGEPLLRDGSGVSNEPPVGYGTFDHEIVATGEHLCTPDGNLTDAGLRVAREKGFLVRPRTGGGLTGHLKE